MRGSDLLDRLKRALRTKTQRELAHRLSLTTVALGNWRNRKRLSVRQVADLFARVERQAVRPDALLELLKDKFQVASELQLARKLDISPQALSHWGNTSLSLRRISNVVFKAYAAGAYRAESSAIRPVVEFFPLERAASKRGKKQELFSISVGGKPHPYRKGLQAELKGTTGVYIFFDSRGRALYAGKAKKQSIWKEMCLAFNRGRRVQRLKRVEHPERMVQYKTSDERSRQIKPIQLPLHELAAYFSAYDVSDGLIGELESLLVRAFPNDLLNVRMERFDQQRRSRAKSR